MVVLRGEGICKKCAEIIYLVREDVRRLRKIASFLAKTDPCRKN